MALKRQQSAEDASVLGLRACVEGSVPVLRAGPLWGPGTVSPAENSVIDDHHELQFHNADTSTTGIVIYLLPTTLARVVMQSPPSLCPLVRLFPLSFRNRLTVIDLELMHVSLIMTIPRRD